jgi:hypothetical protein
VRLDELRIGQTGDFVRVRKVPVGHADGEAVVGNAIRGPIRFVLGVRTRDATLVEWRKPGDQCVCDSVSENDMSLTL